MNKYKSLLSSLKTIFICAFVAFSYSCSKNNLLELEVENLYLSASCLNEDCFANGNLYENSLKNIVSFSLKNNSKYTYIISSTCLGEFNSDIGCSLPNSFPMLNTGLSINNFLFKDLDADNFVEASFATYHESDISRQNDSLLINHYKRMGYNEEYDFNLIIREFIKENLIIVPAGETIFLETFLYLPCNEPSFQARKECVLLNKNGNYTASLIIKSDSTRVKEFLPRDMLKTFEKNGYKFFVGKLVSNEIPVVLKE